MNHRKPIVAIDGPVGAGKTTTARLAAKKLGFIYIDTGAMYRAVTLDIINNGIDTSDENAAKTVVDNVKVDLIFEDGTQKTFLDGKDVSGRIRDMDVTRAVSDVSAMKSVRDKMTAIQRELGRKGGVVMEGRDIGTVVFPDAEIKIYLDADISARAERRHKELVAKGVDITLDALKKEIAERDRANSEREIAPLRKAPDSLIVDTTNMTLDEQVDFIVETVKNFRI